MHYSRNDTITSTLKGSQPIEQITLLGDLL